MRCQNIEEYYKVNDTGFMLVDFLVKMHALKLGCVCRSYAFNGFALASSY
jgi:hypothetical protein